MTNEQREQRYAPCYGAAPVRQGPFWLGYNDAKGNLPYHNDYLLLIDRYEYHKGYAAGKYEAPNLT